MAHFYFQKKLTDPSEYIVTRSKYDCKAELPVPGYRTLAANLLARIWNKSTDIQNAKTLGEAKKAPRKLSQSLVKE